MRNLVVAILAAIIPVAALAGESPVKMTKAELLAFLPGTQSSYETKAGSTQRWKNEPDGKFVASSSNKRYGSVLGGQNVTASGTWLVNDKGQYCVTIDWRRELTDWCAFVFKGANGEYFIGGNEPARRIEFVK